MKLAAMLTNRHKALLMIIITFLGGLVAGSSGKYLWSGQPLVKQANPSQSIVDEIERTARLNASQRAQVEQIVNRTSQQYADLRIEFRMRQNTIRDTCRQRVRAVLSPEQQLLYDQWIQELDARREHQVGEEAARKTR
jgi:hypothetical protein